MRFLAKSFKTEIAAYRLVIKDPRTPRAARWLLAAALGYFLSPIDAIVDSIPGLGFVDDIIVVGLLTWLALRLIPKEVIEDCRKKASPKNSVAPKLSS
ncbi:MAG: DUF1232 domain-containing protein [Candidatus Kerfeldbacteria bacterium]|nr:DUF1232 domain-containing protein [Candidatus Kerfeldbacteria bacterium]